MESEGEGKRCVRCGESKPRAAFARKRSNLDGLQRHCRDCAASYHLHATDTHSRGEQDPVPSGHKRCRGCGEVKPHSEWHGKGGRLASRCKSCRAITRPAEHLKGKYGLTVAERDAMIAAQRGLCVICLNAPAVHVDHCHKTGRVRGVLCFNCNSAIGKLGDDPEAVRRAAAYLEGNSWKPILVAPGVYQLPS
ncbi:endonuclease VII domain-containing protein [Streptomyces sp. NRRL F-2799]|uniref:endonuclease VII domain-containing protein n=1 Tax=Streptomyces sp. NRRL F-2799 TaxID=1463844 RepID=UPI0004C66081|nr:endonuclease VII domain-containing protein [Streptomyces sp. NRRL F-2799]